MTGGGQQIGQGVPQGRAPAVADVQRPGGVGADELHLDFDAGAHVAVAVSRTQPVNFRDHPVPIGVGDEKVDEAGPGDLHLQEHALRGREVVDDDFGHLPGRHLGLLGQDQGQVGGQVAVLRRVWPPPLRRRAGSQRRAAPASRARSALAVIRSRMVFLMCIICQLSVGFLDDFREHTCGVRSGRTHRSAPTEVQRQLLLVPKLHLGTQLQPKLSLGPSPCQAKPGGQ